MKKLNGAHQTWELLQTNLVLQHPFVTVAMEQLRLPDGSIISDWPTVYTQDYVNALVLNEAGEVLVLEGYKHGRGNVCWQMIGGYLEPDEDPFTAVQRELLEETGYQTSDWSYLGSHIIDANRHVGIGHFFCAQRARQVSEVDNSDLEAYTIKWVSQADVRLALLDGRLPIMSHALTVSLALLTTLK